jgi:ABC-type polysaccharide/polyol phosphate export permease
LLIVFSLLTSLAYLGAGLWFFRKLEARLADIL